MLLHRLPAFTVVSSVRHDVGVQAEPGQIRTRSSSVQNDGVKAIIDERRGAAATSYVLCYDPFLLGSYLLLLPNG